MSGENRPPLSLSLPLSLCSPPLASSSPPSLSMLRKYLITASHVRDYTDLLCIRKAAVVLSMERDLRRAPTRARSLFACVAMVNILDICGSLFIRIRNKRTLNKCQRSMYGVSLKIFNLKYNYVLRRCFHCIRDCLFANTI